MRAGHRHVSSPANIANTICTFCPPDNSGEALPLRTTPTFPAVTTLQESCLSTRFYCVTRTARSFTDMPMSVRGV